MKVLKLLTLGTVVLSISAGVAGCSSAPAADDQKETEPKTSEVDEKEKKSDSEEKKEPESEIQELELKNFAYNVVSGGYIHYVLEVENPNEDYAPEFVHVTVTGKNEDDSIAFSDDWTFSPVPAKATTYWVNQAGNGSADDSVTVTAKLSVKESDWRKSAPVGEIYRIENTSVQEGNYGMSSVTGEITLLNDSEVDGHPTESPMLVAIFRDENGNIISGISTFYNSDLIVDETVPFEISGFGGDIPDNYSSFEVYANPWY